MLLKSVNHASDVELLAEVIGNRKTAEKLLRKVGGSLFSLVHQSPETNGDLFCEEGASTYAGSPLTKLQAAREIVARSIKEALQAGASMNSPSAVRDFLKLKLANIPHEVFACIFLDAQHRVIAYEEMFRGTLTQTSVYPREVVKTALRHNAAAVIFSHNHPSGIAEPSRADEALTAALKQALALVDVRTLDHFIVAGNTVLSFAERGLL